MSVGLLGRLLQRFSKAAAEVKRVGGSPGTDRAHVGRGWPRPGHVGAVQRNLGPSRREPKSGGAKYPEWDTIARPTGSTGAPSKRRTAETQPANSARRHHIAEAPLREARPRTRRVRRRRPVRIGHDARSNAMQVRASSTPNENVYIDLQRRDAPLFGLETIRSAGEPEGHAHRHDRQCAAGRRAAT